MLKKLFLSLTLLIAASAYALPESATLNELLSDATIAMRFQSFTCEEQEIVALGLIEWETLRSKAMLDSQDFAQEKTQFMALIAQLLDADTFEMRYNWVPCRSVQPVVTAEEATQE